MIRLLIADDSSLTRTVLRDLLSRDPEIQIVAEVENGLTAVQKTAELRPDLIIMDVIMPVMDGLTAVAEIMADIPTPILVLSANIDPSDSLNAFNAIRLGALDVMAKPEGIVTEAFNEVAAQLIARIKELARVRVIHHFRRQRETLLPTPPPDGQHRILAIGASTGGPKAILHLLKALPADIGASILIVQHISSGFAPGFAAWLHQESDLTVRIAQEGEILQPGIALVAPNHRHMVVQKGRIHLNDAVPRNCCRPSVDVLFESLATHDLAPSVVALLLTGMGRDGAAGMAALYRRGAHTIAQNETSCAVFGMPKSAISLNAAHQVLSLEEIPAAVTRLLHPVF
ncbi:MAG: chemotaxis response regulator protein-glutamate methylesterase [Desulfuromonas sp.]|nr:MAG: chemotaxis response regulator protein-glutamate methylesterase [Desulfuromonas sp.]